MANTYLTRTPSGAGNRKIWTYSVWVKRSKLGASQGIISSGSARGYMYFPAADGFQIEQYNAGDEYSIVTNRKFRDSSGYYHLVIAFDTTQATASDRVKLYVNGVQETSFSKATYPSQNFDTNWNSAVAHTIGNINTATYFDGSMSHIHFIDGTAYDASAFGEYDANGVWKINTSPSVTYGTNGFFILKDGNSVTDQSGNSNNFTVAGGTLTNTEDNPSNVFATMNPLDNFYPAMTLSEGNTKALTTVPDKYTYIPTTLGMTSGKYYAEIKVTAQSGSENEFLIGITSTSTGVGTAELGNYANDYGYFGLTGQSRNNDTLSSYGSTYTVGDIIGIAVDLDNNKLYFSKNGTWQNSGDPTSGATGTGAISITDPISTPRGAYFFAVMNFSSTTTATFDANFGNGYFGTTAVSSAGTNASGIGIFEYDVPTGYTALSTKGLNL